MAQILDPVPHSDNDSILCCYVNSSSRIQVARITNIDNWYFERVVFPGQRLVFEATPAALLEIHTGMMASAILSDTIPCQKIIVEEKREALEKNIPTSVNNFCDVAQEATLTKQKSRQIKNLETVVI